MNDNPIRGTRVANILMATLIVLLVAILGFVIWSAFSGRGSTHRQILDRQVMIEQQLIFLSCIELLHPDQRTPETIAECQVNP